MKRPAACDGEPLTQEVVSPMPNQYTMPNTAERFWTKVQFTETCWLWQAAVRGGYGSFTLFGQSVLAHRYAYEFCVGPIAEGLEIDHLCCVTMCVRPDHLEVVTRRENNFRSLLTPTAINARKTHCIHGHEFNEANTYHRSETERTCRTCQRKWAQQYRKTQRLARAV